VSPIIAVPLQYRFTQLADAQSLEFVQAVPLGAPVTVTHIWLVQRPDKHCSLNPHPTPFSRRESQIAVLVLVGVGSVRQVTPKAEQVPSEEHGR